jgi:hypothetical protein
MSQSTYSGLSDRATHTFFFIFILHFFQALYTASTDEGLASERVVDTSNHPFHVASNNITS